MILIIDFGGQYTHLICRRIRNLGYYSEIVHSDASIDEIKKFNPDAIILSGGPQSVNGKNSPTVTKKIFDLEIPILGICYGHQLIGKMLGGKVVKSSKEYGKEILESKNSQILRGFDEKEQVWMSHGDQVEKEPSGFEVVGRTKECKIAAYENKADQIYGVQFHPEVIHTPNGIKVLKNFLATTKAKANYSAKNLGDQLISQIKEQLDGEAVIMGVSGGVDSLVASEIIRRATDKIYCVFVDHGFLRKDEAEYVKKIYKELGFKHFYHVDASKLFLNKIKGVSDPEKKRKIIGNTFVEIFDQKVMELKKDHGEIAFLGQGTIYPDRVESSQTSKNTVVIKTHHNVGGLPKNMKLKLLEPLQDLYKDEVRALGKTLGIKEEYLQRHPFPGPGLAIRVLGEVTKEKLETLRAADHIFIETLRKHSEYDNVWQALCALLPVKTVGVMGDERTYGSIIAIRAVTSIDAMTADWARLPDQVLEEISSQIVRKVENVNRIVYDITSKPPGTIEFE